MNSFILNYQHKVQGMTLNQVMSLLAEAPTFSTDSQHRFTRKIKQTCKRCGLYTSHTPHMSPLPKRIYQAQFQVEKCYLEQLMKINLNILQKSRWYR